MNFRLFLWKEKYLRVLDLFSNDENEISIAKNSPKRDRQQTNT